MFPSEPWENLSVLSWHGGGLWEGTGGLAALEVELKVMLTHVNFAMKTSLEGLGFTVAPKS